MAGQSTQARVEPGAPSSGGAGSVPGVSATEVPNPWFSWAYVEANRDDIVDALTQHVTLTLQERPYRPVDLFATGLENPDDLFVAVEEPVGVIEVMVERE